MSDYADILQQSWDNIPEAKALPIGTYLLKARNATFQPPKADDKKPVVLFVYQPKEAMDDVSTADLEALGDNYDISDNRVFVRFFIETNADWDRVRKHIVKHGVEVKGKSIEEGLKAVQGSEVLAYLDQSTFTDKNTGEVRTQNDAKEFAPLEA